MKNQKHISTLVAILILNSFTARAQQPMRINDHLFSPRGKSMLTVATGIPYVGIVEYAYGFSDRFSIGVTAGITPQVIGYGVRVRGVILQRDENFRMYVSAPIFYYPQTKDLGGEPWLLTWPVLSCEWKLNSGTRLSVGGGIVAATCAKALLGVKEMEGEGFMGGIWNTLHGGVAVPLSNNITFQGEVSAVMSGVKIAGKDWVGGPPVILVLGFSYSLF